MSDQPVHAAVILGSAPAWQCSIVVDQFSRIEAHANSWCRKVCNGESVEAYQLDQRLIPFCIRGLLTDAQTRSGNTIRN